MNKKHTAIVLSEIRISTTHGTKKYGRNFGVVVFLKPIKICSLLISKYLVILI